MKIRTLILSGLLIAVSASLLGCGKIIAPVDTYGFTEAFEERTEPTKGSSPIGKESIQLAEDVLNAVSKSELDLALEKLETLRKQNDLSPRQRLETKSLHTAVSDYLKGPDGSTSTQNAGTSIGTPQPAG